MGARSSHGARHVAEHDEHLRWCFVDGETQGRVRAGNCKDAAASCFREKTQTIEERRDVCYGPFIPRINDPI